ncbi:FMN-binding protein [Enterococcus italicus]|uniref:extracellular electron transfer flavoprotein PplA n=1 Tax=Enterococcus italicus TaxID=246144 RepID=UPI002073ED09|nr:extracellular electron transfer flavoprotein PplA [Enterococcus italicus]MCM6881326.1 FMN-binding protein [Enterococcus italicus]
MKKKKIVTGITMLVLSGLVLAGCSSDNEKSTTSSSSTTTSSTSKITESSASAGMTLKDGTYKLKELNDNNGYHANFSIVVKDGKISESNFDYLNADGKSKKDDADYNKNMKAKSGISPKEYIEKFNEELVSTQNPSNIEVVTGATHSFHSFQNYAQQLIQAAQSGDTKEIEIDNGATLKDGTYTLKELNDSNGYHAVFSIVVKDGKITESNFDYLNADGKSKKDDADYNKNMKAKSGISPKEYIEKFNEDLVSEMNKEDGTPGNIDVVTGATHSFHSFVLYAEQLVNAAEKGDTKTIEIDNYVEQ